MLNEVTSNVNTHVVFVFMKNHNSTLLIAIFTLLFIMKIYKHRLLTSYNIQYFN